MIKTVEIILEEIRGVCEQVHPNQIEEILKYFKKDIRIFIEGEGRSGFIAKCFAMRLMHLEYEVYVVGETITPAMRKKDVYIGVSGSGCTENVLVHAKKAEEKGCLVLAFSAKNKSPLSEIAQCTFVIPGNVKADRGEERKSVQLLSSLFDQSLHVIVDAITLMISRRDHMENEKAVNNHF